jgi:GT2 family glycosyltransferase
MVKGIALLIPARDWMPASSVQAILGLAYSLPPGSRVVLLDVGSNTATTRNALTRVFLGTDLDYALCVDADMLPPPQLAQILLAHAERGGWGMVSALYFARRPPHRPEAWLLDGTDATRERAAFRSGLHEAEAVGFGAVLVRRAVFEAVGDPWFQFAEEHPGFDEDRGFCRRARAAGQRIAVDLDCVVPHIAFTQIDRASALGWAATHPDHPYAWRHLDEERAPP